MLEEEIRYELADYESIIKLIQKSGAIHQKTKKKHDTYFGIFRGIKKPSLVQSWYTPKKALLKAVIFAAICGISSLIVMAPLVFLLSYIADYKQAGTPA